MQIPNNVKSIGNWVGMPTAALVTCFVITSKTSFYVNKLTTYLMNVHRVKEDNAKKIWLTTTLCISTFLTFGVLPRILPFTKVSYGVVPHWNWSWIEARLPNR
jgi:hypothetical protein